MGINTGKYSKIFLVAAIAIAFCVSFANAEERRIVPHLEKILQERLAKAKADPENAGLPYPIEMNFLDKSIKYNDYTYEELEFHVY